MKAKYINMAMANEGLTMTDAAQSLGISRQWFYERLKKENLPGNQLCKLMEILGAKCYGNKIVCRDGTLISWKETGSED